MRGYAPKNHPPVANVESKKLKVNVISAISRFGTLRFMLYEGNMNSQRLRDFLARLVKGKKSKKVFCIFDNLKVHHSKPITEWVGQKQDVLELFYLPSYAPEYNPDELVNSDIKRNAGARVSPKSQEKLEHNVRSRLMALQTNPSLVAAFFTAPLTMYSG
jgi:transposase